MREDQTTELIYQTLSKPQVASHVKPDTQHQESLSYWLLDH